MATRLLRTSALIQQAPVRALASRIIGFSTVGGSRKPALFPRPLSFESCYNFYASSRQSPCPNNYFLTLQTTPQFAITQFSSIQQEISFIKSTLQDSGIQLTSAALADKKAKLSSLELAYRQWHAKALWWKDIIEQEPKQIESHSDVYQRVKAVKDGLKTDGESNTPIWTARERGEMEK
ncbi:MAG: hypothetical protein Q9198_003822, partial [Flavoplaca austrocitrina]